MNTKPMALATLLLLATAQADDLTFETAVAELDETPRERMLDGTVEAVNQATMSAQTAGRIAEVFFDVDDYVQAGEPIVRFTDVEQQSALRQAQAALALGADEVNPSWLPSITPSSVHGLVFRRCIRIHHTVTPSSRPIANAVIMKY